MPLLGRIWASYPFGSSINSPVGIRFRSKGCHINGSKRLALRSIPAEPAVAYAGNGFEDIFTI